MQPGYRPVDSAELRPKRVWFVVGAVIALAGIVAGGVMLAYGILGIAKPMTRTFAEGETVNLRLDQDTAIYLATEQNRYRANCEATAANGEPAAMRRPEYSFTRHADGQEWHLIRTIPVSTPADYEVTCTQTPGPYAISDQPDMRRFVIGVVSVFVLSGLGLLIGTPIAIVVGVKRSNHRRRLTEERMRGA